MRIYCLQKCRRSFVWPSLSSSQQFHHPPLTAPGAAFSVTEGALRRAHLSLWPGTPSSVHVLSQKPLTPCPASILVSWHPFLPYPSLLLLPDYPRPHQPLLSLEFWALCTPRPSKHALDSVGSPPEHVTAGGIRPGTAAQLSLFSWGGASAPTSSPDFQDAHKNAIPTFSLLLSVLCALGSFTKQMNMNFKGEESVNHCKSSQASKSYKCYLAKDQRKAQ